MSKLAISDPKYITPATRDCWPEISEDTWQDYRWQLKNRLQRLQDLEPDRKSVV